MPQSKDSFLTKMHKHLFADEETLPQVFDSREQDIIIRYRATFTKWYSEPHLRDIQIIHHLTGEYGISERQAYRDLANIKALIGNIKNASKDFQRYRASEMILRGYEVAKDATKNVEVKQAMAMIRAGEALVKVHKLDKDDLDNIPWDDIIPINLEPTTDVSVIPNRKKIENLEELQAKMRKKYGAAPIEDISFTEVDDDRD